MEKIRVGFTLAQEVYDKFIWLMANNNRNQTLQLKQLIEDAYNQQKENK